MASGRFRTKKYNFSMVSNEFLRNKDISLKAKGLYCMIQSYVTIPDFILYKSFLLKNCKEGKNSFESTWQELKESGYLVQYKTRDNDGKFVYEYDLLDHLPQDILFSHTPKNAMVLS